MRFHRFGLGFDYPENWVVDTDDSGGSHAAVTVYSPGGAFWSVSAHAPGGEQTILAAAVVQQMRDEYRDLDSEPAVDTLAGHTLRGFDLNFYCLDLTNTAQVRTLATPSAIYLLCCQAEDREWERICSVFEAMKTSFIESLASNDTGLARNDTGLESEDFRFKACIVAG